MFRTTKKEAVFFDEFVNIITLTHEAAKCLKELLYNYTDVEIKIKHLTDYEHRCDSMVHSLYDRVNSSFITPIDREDILAICSTLDSIMDDIEESGYLFHVYNITEIKEPAKKIAGFIVDATEGLIKVIQQMPDNKFIKQMRENIIEVNRIENLGDFIYRDEMTALFRAESDPLQIIRWKDIYNQLEKTLDACEHVANIVEGVVVKHA